MLNHQLGELIEVVCDGDLEIRFQLAHPIRQGVAADALQRFLACGIDGSQQQQITVLQGFGEAIEELPGAAVAVRLNTARSRCGAVGSGLRPLRTIRRAISRVTCTSLGWWA